MALKSKFCISWIVLSAVFISLTVSSAEQKVEGHKCYWCGPLAEQVHRSQRAPKCSGDRSKVTVCDNDLAYCAIVGTSPPYIESRYCIKFYQDECYSLYCNTTKTLKITCPCRGELCNGINTLRENEAFKSLKHNIDKITHNMRLKRTIIGKGGFIGLSTSRNKIDNMTTDETKQAQNGTINNSTIVTENSNNIPIVNDNSIVNITNIITKIESTRERIYSVSEPTENFNDLSSEYAKTDAMFTDSEEMGTSVSVYAVKDNQKALESYTNQIKTSTASIDIKIENKGSTSDEYIKQMDIPSASIMSSDLKTEIIIVSSEIPKETSTTTTEMSTKLFQDKANVETSAAEGKLTTLNTKIMPETTASVIKTTMTDATTNVMKLNSKKSLPSADALQHNDTPVMKTEQIATTTITNMNVPTQASMPQNSTAIRIESKLLQYAVVITIMLYN